MADVTFFFDPACPWTWRASRWLTLVAETRGLDIEWRPLSLFVLKGGDVPDPVHRARLETSQRALVLMERLRRNGREDTIPAFYTEIGNLVHEAGEPFDGPVLEHAARESGVADHGAALDEALFNDPELRSAVENSTATAMAAAGPNVGSPVLVLAGAERGLHGPVLGSVPDKAESLALWEAVEALAPIQDFFEIKRGRS